MLDNPKHTFFCIFNDNNLEIETEFIETISGERFQIFETALELTQHLKQKHFQESAQSRVESVDRFIVDHIHTQEYHFSSLFSDKSNTYILHKKEYKLYSNCVFCRRLFHTYKDYVDNRPDFILQSYSSVTQNHLLNHMYSHINYRPLQCALCEPGIKGYLPTSREWLYSHVKKAHNVYISDYRAERPEEYYKIVREYLLPEIDA